MSRKCYSKEAKEYLYAHHSEYSFEGMTERINTLFGYEKTVSNIKRYMQHLRLAPKSKNKVSKYTEEMDQFIFDNCKGISVAKLAELFNERFGTEVTKQGMKARMGRIGAKNELLLHKETHPAINHPNAIATRFKKGQECITASPIGTERLSADGYYQIKVSKDKWILKQRLIYQEAYGDLKDDEEVIFLDGDKSNFELSNLMKISKSESIRLNYLGLRSNDKELTKAGVGIVRLDQKIRRLQKGN